MLSKWFFVAILAVFILLQNTKPLVVIVLKWCNYYDGNHDMKIEFNKQCNSFGCLLQNPTDRKAIKNFNKDYNSKLIPAALKLYQKMKSSDNAYIYNMTASANNKIELLSGLKDSDVNVLKIRVQGSYRKFFHFYSDSETKKFSLKKEWRGQFNEICMIYIYEVNNHDYKSA